MEYALRLWVSAFNCVLCHCCALLFMYRYIIEMERMWGADMEREIGLFDTFKRGLGVYTNKIMSVPYNRFSNT